MNAATVVDGSNNSKSYTCAVPVNGGTSSTLTYDKNGNMTSDGTNTYAWDAENRLIKISYPGTGNYSSFVSTHILEIPTSMNARWVRRVRRNSMSGSEVLVKKSVTDMEF